MPHNETSHQQESTPKPWLRKALDSIPWTAIAATAAGFIVSGIPGAIIAGGSVVGYKGYKTYKEREAEQKSASNPQPALQDSSKQPVKANPVKPLTPTLTPTSRKIQKRDKTDSLKVFR